MSRFAPLLLLAGACATVPRDAGFADVRAIARERIGKDLRWDRGGEEDAQVRERLRALLTAPLTADGAVELALLNNRGIQAVYEELGIGQADLVQAGLLRNPTFGASVGFPTTSGSRLGSDFSITQDFLDIFTLPLRKSVAERQFQQAKLRVGNAVLQLAADVRSGYFTLLAAQHMTQMLREISQGQDAVSELAQRQREAGNINDLELALEIDAAQSARVAVARSDAQVLEARERLARLLGVFGADTGFRIAELLPELPQTDPPLDGLETLAIEQRLDLAAAKSEREVLASTLSAASVTRFFPAVQVGASVLRDPEGITTVGPTLSLELPIFDQGQARLARLEAQTREATARVEELAVQVRSQVRATRNRLVQGRAIVDFYRTSLLPLRERILRQSQLHYNAMQIGLPQLVVARQNLTNAYREYVDALREYWTARSDLELAVGGGLSKRATQAGAKDALHP